MNQDVISNLHRKLDRFLLIDEYLEYSPINFIRGPKTRHFPQLIIDGIVSTGRCNTYSATLAARSEVTTYGWYSRSVSGGCMRKCK